MVDALASDDEEGRGRLRKVSGSCEQALIRKYPNGATHCGKATVPTPEYIGREEVTEGSETSQYLEE